MPNHILIPRHIFQHMTRNHMWQQLKKNPKYWVMVSASLVAAPSCALSTMVQKMTSYEHLHERANVSLMKDETKYGRFLKHWTPSTLWSPSSHSQFPSRQPPWQRLVCLFHGLPQVPAVALSMTVVRFHIDILSIVYIHSLSNGIDSFQADGDMLCLLLEVLVGTPWWLSGYANLSRFWIFCMSSVLTGGTIFDLMQIDAHCEQLSFLPIVIFENFYLIKQIKLYYLQITVLFFSKWLFVNGFVYKMFMI